MQEKTKGERGENKTLQSNLQEAAANFINTISNRQSLITVTGVVVSPDQSNVTFLLSVFPADREATALDFLKRNRPECKEYIKTHVRLRHIPLVDFAIDEGEKARQHIDELLV